MDGQFTGYEVVFGSSFRQRESVAVGRDEFTARDQPLQAIFEVASFLASA
jgi:hypothetical protein